MMTDTVTTESLKYMIARLLDNANDAMKEYREDKGNKFFAGRKMAYYEMLDILKTELDVRDEDLKELGLDIDLVENYA
ncbi:MAG: hypothetical protein NC302_07850 [Bacteroidales bacterium]|nr:hypothetical protein [Bacteroidales bacterium]MCM1415556.1 transposase [bacterium]MCM1424084.1 transposase [bacterium]